MLSCPMGKLQKPTPVVPTKLPDTGTGYGSVLGTAQVVWAAAMLSVFAFGASAAGLRKYGVRKQR